MIGVQGRDDHYLGPGIDEEGATRNGIINGQQAIGECQAHSCYTRGLGWAFPDDQVHGWQQFLAEAPGEPGLSVVCPEWGKFDTHGSQGDQRGSRGVRVLLMRSQWGIQG